MVFRTSFSKEFLSLTMKWRPSSLHDATDGAALWHVTEEVRAKQSQRMEALTLYHSMECPEQDAALPGVRGRVALR